MKYIFTILILLPLILKSQNRNYKITDFVYEDIRTQKIERYNRIPVCFIQNKIDWKKWDIQLSNFEKDEYLKKISGNVFFEKPYIIEREEYHLIDFNADGKLDVIYAGRNPSGGEIDNFGFFENQGDSLRLTLKLLGSIIEIKKSETNSPIEFAIWIWPCCAEVLNTIEYYKYYFEKDKKYCENKDRGSYSESYGKFIKNNYPNFLKYHNYTYIKTTFLPTKLEQSLNNVIISNNTIVETNPNYKIIEIDINAYISDEFKNSLSIAKLKIGQEVSVLNSATINGENYLFICIPKSQNVNSEYIISKPVENLLGWIKLKDTKQIGQ